MTARFALTSLLLTLALTLIVVPGSAQDGQSPPEPAPARVDASPGVTAPWHVETVDASPGVGTYVSVAIDAQGTPYISYHDETNDSLKMAKYVGTGGNCGTDNRWSCETVDKSSGDVGRDNSIALDPTTNLPAIAYWTATSPQHLKLATATTSGWDIVKIQDGPGRYASLKFDATGIPHIAYWTFGAVLQKLNYARYVGGGAGNCGGNDFQCDVLFGGDYALGQHPSLDLTSTGQSRIAHEDGSKDALMYAFPSGSAWTSQAVLPCAHIANASLAVDAAHGDRAHMVIHCESYGELKYAGYVGSGGNCGPGDSWQCDVIDDVGGKTHIRGVSVAVDNAGYPIIAYHKYAGDPFVIASLNVARPAAAFGRKKGNCGPDDEWQCERIQGAGHGGDYLSIAVGPSGLATLAHSNHDHFGSLRVAYQRYQAFVPLVLR